MGKNQQLEKLEFHRVLKSIILGISYKKVLGSPARHQFPHQKTSKNQGRRLHGWNGTLVYSRSNWSYKFFIAPYKLGYIYIYIFPKNGRKERGICFFFSGVISGAELFHPTYNWLVGTYFGRNGFIYGKMRWLTMSINISGGDILEAP